MSDRIPTAGGSANKATLRASAGSRATVLCRTIAALASMFLCVLLLAQPTWAQAPRGFVGVNADGPAVEPTSSIPDQVRAMARAGVQSVRWAVYWPALQPYRSWLDVPLGRRSEFEDAGGIPTDFRTTDRLVAAAGRANLRLLPIVMAAAPWAAENPFVPFSPPLNYGDFGRFAGTLAARYGTRGSFWRTRAPRARRPVRTWQIWNEPAGWEGFNTFTTFWESEGDALEGYVAMLRSARRELRVADPKARVLLSGLFGKSWISLDQLYAVGARDAFDAVAIHPFAVQPADVIQILNQVRQVMARHGDRGKPLHVIELAWPSALGRVRSPSPFAVTRRQQADRLSRAYHALARERRRLRLRAVYWYTWMTRDASPTISFDYAGLLTRDQTGRVRRKPAFHALRRTARRLNGRGG